MCNQERSTDLRAKQLSDTKGASLSLTVSGYQFPEIQTDWCDSNWLNITGKVEQPRGSWTFADACMLTSELASLCDWLESIAASPNPSHQSICFLEPNLVFHVVRANEQAVLRVNLSLECSPPWFESREERINGVDLDFPLESNDLVILARVYREQLSRYPQRPAE
jgi:hypothetical protein